MSSIGPDLPPHLLAKRKRQTREESTAAKPDLPAQRSPDGSEKRQRVIGPAAPPAPLNERPSEPANEDDSDSSSDDGFGPSLPTGEAAKKTYDAEDDVPARKVPETKEEPSIKRDDWMTMPPTADGLAKNMDPSKRARQFRSGKGASSGGGGGGGMDSSWTETPDEKRKRLQNQVLGVASAPSAKTASTSARSKHDEEAARRIKEHNEKHRGQSLFDQHKGGEDVEEDDDPSKRAFDREKDIGGSLLGKSQQKEMMKRASNFSSKFSGGKYL